MTAVETRGFELASWQEDAVDAWLKGDEGGTNRGTLEVVTGGGKTLIALACAARIAANEPELRVAIVVPTEALARQWRAALVRYTNVRHAEIGLLGAGGKDSFRSMRVLVSVLNSAADRLPALARTAQPLMLIVDECHRAGAPSFSRVLTTPAQYRLGLSATPDRDELDEDGEPLAYDDQLVGQSLGRVVYRFTLRDAQERGWLPDYDIHHHGLALTPEERSEYDAASRRVDDLAEQLRDRGFDSGRAQQLRVRADDIGQLARSYIAATAQRKGLLYRAEERHRVAQQLVQRALRDGKHRVLLFHERVTEAAALAERLSEAGIPGVGLEHSRLRTSERVAVVEDFRNGRLPVLVSVKSLVEGIDVPEADAGISVASSSSVRQRVQSLGRVLRRQFDTSAPSKHAEMHVLYVAETVDELIYAKEDWADLTGDGANHYWLWALHGEAEPADGPPASPRPTEEQEWDRLDQRAPEAPTPWQGVLLGQEYSVDTLGTVTNSLGATISNAQHVADLVTAVRGRPGGRFRVTPTHLLVLIWGEGESGSVPFVAGQLAEPFVVEPEDVGEAGHLDLADLAPGDIYPGRATREGGTFKLSQKRGGVIERRTREGSEFALVEGTNAPELQANARRVLEAWRQVLDRGITFHVTGDGHAWYTTNGKRRFLAAVPGGFAWPSTQEAPLS